MGPLLRIYASNKLQQARACPICGLTSRTGSGSPTVWAPVWAPCWPQKGGWTHPLHGLAPPPPNIKYSRVKDGPGPVMMPPNLTDLHLI
jgi:hypothetical protein